MRPTTVTNHPYVRRVAPRKEVQYRAMRRTADLRRVLLGWTQVPGKPRVVPRSRSNSHGMCNANKRNKAPQQRGTIYSSKPSKEP
jgi:hypothetical protein